MLKKLFSHTVIYGLAPQITRVAQVFILPIVTPFLTATDYGVSGIIAAVVGAVSVFSSLGLNIVLANSYTKSPNHYIWLWRQIYGFLIMWSFVYALIVAAIVYLFIPHEAKENTWQIILLNVIPILLFSPVTNIGSLYYQLKQNPFQIAIRSVIIGFLTLFLNLLFIKYLRMGYMGWFYANAIAQIAYQFSYFIPVNFSLNIKPIYNFRRKTIKEQLLICLPSIPHYYNNYILSSFDRLIMTFYGIDTASIGKYNAANIPSGLFASATSAANQAIGPLLLQAYKSNDKPTEIKMNFSTMIFFLVATSITSLFLKELLPLIIRSKGLEGIYSIAIILIMANNYRPMYVASVNKLFYVEKTKALLKVTAIASVICVTLNLFFIYIYGYEAAAITIFISFMYMGYSGFYIKEFKENDGANHYPLFWLSLTILLTVFVYFAVELGLIIRIAIAFLLLLVGCIGLLRINKNYTL